MMRHAYHRAVYAMLLGLWGTTACTPLAQTAQKAGADAKQAVSDTRDAWADVFTYTPPKKPQLPQTRYCYRTMSDVVCYDSVQPTLTSHLDGYQDGENISWIQPGGGSLGVSGGTPTAAPGAEHAQIAPNAQAVPDSTSATTSGDNSSISSAPVAPPASDLPAAKSSSTDTQASDAPTPDRPFYRKESPYIKSETR